MTKTSTTVQCSQCLAIIPARVDDRQGWYEDDGCPNGCDDALASSGLSAIRLIPTDEELADWDRANGEETLAETAAYDY